MPAQKRGSPPLTGARGDGAVAAPSLSQKNIVWNAAISNPSTDDAQAAEIAAVNFLVRRHFLRPVIAKIIAAEFYFAGADR